MIRPIKKANHFNNLILSCPKLYTLIAVLEELSCSKYDFSSVSLFFSIKILLIFNFLFFNSDKTF